MCVLSFPVSDHLFHGSVGGIEDVHTLLNLGGRCVAAPHVVVVVVFFLKASFLSQ